MKYKDSRVRRISSIIRHIDAALAFGGNRAHLTLLVRDLQQVASEIAIEAIQTSTDLIGIQAYVDSLEARDAAMQKIRGMLKVSARAEVS